MLFFVFLPKKKFAKKTIEKQIVFPLSFIKINFTFFCILMFYIFYQKIVEQFHREPPPPMDSSSHAIFQYQKSEELRSSVLLPP